MAAMMQSNPTVPSVTKLFTPGVIFLLTISILGFFLSAFAADFAMNIFAISGRGLMKARIWQLVTYPFVNIMPMNLVFSGFMILFIGSAIEREWRTASFLILWLVVSVVCGILWVLITSVLGGGYIGTGSGACTYGLLATFGLLNRGRRLNIFFATLEAQYLVLIFIAIGIILNIMQPIGLIWISGALVAYIYVKLRWRLSEQSASHTRDSSAPKGRFVDID